MWWKCALVVHLCAFMCVWVPLVRPGEYVCVGGVGVGEMRPGYICTFMCPYVCLGVPWCWGEAPCTFMC